MSIKNLKIIHKVVIIIIAGVVISGSFSILNIIMGHRQINTLESIYKENVIPLDAFRKIQLSFREIEFYMTGVSSDVIAPIGAGKHLEAAMKNIDILWNKLKMHSTDAEAVENFEKGLKGFKLLSIRLKEVYFQEKLEELEDVYDEWLDYKPLIIKSIEKLAENQKRAVNDSYLGSKMLILRTNKIVAVISFVVLIVFIAFAILTVRSIKNPIRIVIEAARQVAEGDLSSTVDVSSRDEMGSMASELNKMLDKLNAAFSSISHEANRISNHAEGLNSASESLMEGTNQQRMQIEQVTSAASEMSQTVLDMAKNASEASSATEESVKSAGNGRDVVNRTVTNITELAESVGTASVSIEELGKRSEEIGDIITVIQDIADQTNLLALNAAIEAARAGEQGRGFAVVADEVRKLAEKTAVSTKEISDKIGRIQKETEDSIVLMTQGKTLADEAVSTVSNAGDALMQIVESSQKVMDMVQSIAAAAEQQSSAAEEVSQSMESIAEVVNNTFSLSEDVKKSSEDSLSVAKELKSQVQGFKTKSGSEQVYIDNFDTSHPDVESRIAT